MTGQLWAAFGLLLMAGIIGLERQERVLKIDSRTERTGWDYMSAVPLKMGVFASVGLVVGTVLYNA